MRRPVSIAALAASLVVAAGPPAAAAPAVKVSVDECGIVTAKKLSGVVFSAEMSYVDDARTMAMRFELYGRLAGERDFDRVPTPDDGWFRSEAVRSYRVDGRTFAFVDLDSPAEYRARVTFRWLDARGRVIEAERRTSPICRLAPRPNLELGSTVTTVGIADSGLRRYAAVVRNTGHADAGAFNATLRIGGAPPLTASVLRVGAEAEQLVTFDAPPCARGSTLRFEVDAGDRVAETDEDDNVLSVDCPAG